MREDNGEGQDDRAAVLEEVSQSARVQGVCLPQHLVQKVHHNHRVSAHKSKSGGGKKNSQQPDNTIRALYFIRERNAAIQGACPIDMMTSKIATKKLISVDKLWLTNTFSVNLSTKLQMKKFVFDIVYKINIYFFVVFFLAGSE